MHPDEFSKDPKTQRLLRGLCEFQRKRKEEFARLKKEFESQYYKEYCYWPRKTTSGTWIWLEDVYVRYSAVKIHYVRVKHTGAIVVTDIRKQYFDHEFKKGKVLEILTPEELENRKKFDDFLSKTINKR